MKIIEHKIMKSVRTDLRLPDLDDLVPHHFVIFADDSLAWRGMALLA